MKKVLLILALCLLILCGCGQGEPVATVPTETAAPTEAPTQASTEAPTEPRELTDEEKKQLHYEQVFAEGSYVIDWSCVNIITSVLMKITPICSISTLTKSEYSSIMSAHLPPGKA